MDAYTAFFVFTTGAAVVALGMRELQWRQRFYEAVKAEVSDWTANFFRRIRWKSNEAAERAMEE